MSTETTNKKIKIDNGTTFGRTYTDKAVDELLKNVGGSGGISVIELTDKNGTIASTQLGEINANPQNFAFKYNGKILLFTKADSTTYQYCNNTTSSSENNVMTTSTLLTITSSTGVYTIAENVHNVVANSIHPANGGDLTNIQVGSKVYSIPSGGGADKKYYKHLISYYLDANIFHSEYYSTNPNAHDKITKIHDMITYLIEVYGTYGYAIFPVWGMISINSVNRSAVYLEYNDGVSFDYLSVIYIDGEGKIPSAGIKFSNYITHEITETVVPVN